MKVKSESEVAQSCPTPSDPMDCSLPGSSVHGVFQARVLEWGAIAFSTHLVMLLANIFSQAVCCLFNFLKKLYWGISYNAVLASGVQQGEPIVQIQRPFFIHPLWERASSHVGHCRVPSRVLCAVQWVLTRYLFYTIVYCFPGGSSGKEPRRVQGAEEAQAPSLGQEDLLEEGMATHSSIPAWRIPWTEEPGGLQSMGLQSQT